VKQSGKDEQQLCRRVVTSWFRDQALRIHPTTFGRPEFVAGRRVENNTTRVQT